MTGMIKLFTILLLATPLVGLSQKIAVKDSCLGHYFCSQEPSIINSSCDTLVLTLNDTLRVIDVSEYTCVSDISIISQLKDLVSANFSNNSVSRIPNPDKNKNFSELNLSNNDFKNDTLDFNLYVNMKFLNISNANVGHVKGIENFTAAESILLQNNNISQLPVFTAKQLNDTKYLNVTYNQLSFSGVSQIPLFKYYGFKEKQVKWYPQDTLRVENNRRSLNIGEYLSLSYPFDDTVSQLTFEWFKNGAPIPNSNHRTFVIDSFAQENAGSYFVKVLCGKPGFVGYEILCGTWEISACNTISQVCYTERKICGKDSVVVRFNAFHGISNGSLPILLEQGNTFTRQIIAGELYPLASGTYTIRSSQECSIPYTINLQSGLSCDNYIDSLLANAGFDVRIDAFERDSISLSASFTSDSTHYLWKKDNLVVTNGNRLTFNDLSKNDAGVYSLHAIYYDSYSMAYDTAYVKSWTIHVDDCQSFTEVDFHKETICDSVDIVFSSIKLANTKIHPDISLVYKSDEIKSHPVHINQHARLSCGEYSLVASSRNCKATWDSVVTLDCDKSCILLGDTVSKWANNFDSTINRSRLSPLVLTSPCQIHGIKYRWFFNDSAMVRENGHSLTIDTLREFHAGTYTLRLSVFNPYAKKDESITVGSWHLKMNECIVINKLSHNAITVCDSIDFNITNIQLDRPVSTYRLEVFNKDGIRKLNDNRSARLSPGQYTIRLVAGACSVEYSKSIVLYKPTENCYNTCDSLKAFTQMKFETSVYEFDTLTITVPLLVNGINGWTWTIDNEVQAEQKANTFTLGNISMGREGWYTASASCIDVYSGKKLEFDVCSVFVNVIKCQEIASFSHEITDDCIDLHFSLISIETTNKSSGFSYCLENVITNKRTHVSTNQSFKINKGIYSLVAFRNSCEAKSDKLIVAEKMIDCNIVLTPDGDGINDFFKIDGSGFVSIMDKSGRIICHKSMPFDWYGVDDKGISLPSGLYAIIKDNEKAFQIRLAR